MIVTEIGTIGASIFALIQLARFEAYLLFDNDTYWAMAKMVRRLVFLFPDGTKIYSSGPGISSHIPAFQMSRLYFILTD